jgi:uncharacterized protein (TIGR02145 family)
MKKNLLLMMLCCPIVLAAQNGVTVSGLAINAGTVTFDVSWEKPMPVELWSDTVWVFVDYNNAGKMERLPLLPGATLTATSPGGKVIEESDNNKGVWVAGNARSAGSFSATVQLLTAVSNVGGACVYASNYPPVGEYKNNATEISFTGTPMYEISLSNSEGETAAVKSGNTFLLPCDYTLTSFTDATGAPGIIIPGYNQPQGSCTYTEPAVVGTFANFDKNYSAATYVSLTDKRDNKNYPVVKIGSRWVMARNLNYQKDLNFNAASNQANGKSFISTTNGTPAIGSFWCPGANGATTSTQVACEVWGALYTWETAMMVDGKFTSSAHNSSTWSEPSSYGTNTNSANTQNHARSDAGAVTGGRGICPPNWHVPTDEEWGVLLNEIETGTKNHNAGIQWLGTDAGTRAKSKCTAPSGDASGNTCENDPEMPWCGSCTESTDTYGFRVHPAGLRHTDGPHFANRLGAVYYWSSTAYSGGGAWRRHFGCRFTGACRGHEYPRAMGFSVRCIRD